MDKVSSLMKQIVTEFWNNQNLLSRWVCYFLVQQPRHVVLLHYSALMLVSKCYDRVPTARLIWVELQPFYDHQLFSSWPAQAADPFPLQKMSGLEHGRGPPKQSTIRKKEFELFLYFSNATHVVKEKRHFWVRAFLPLEKSSLAQVELELFSAV